MTNITISKDILKQFALDNIGNVDEVDDEWLSFDKSNDVIDVNIYNDGVTVHVTAYPVIKVPNTAFNTTDTSNAIQHITI